MHEGATIVLGEDNEFGRLSDWVRSVIEPAQHRPGELDAGTFAHALLLDLRNAGRSFDPELALPTDEAIDTCKRLSALIKGEPTTVHLPYRTPVSAERPGSVRIGDAVYVRLSDLPGLHRLETVARDARGPNLEALRYRIRSRASSTAVGEKLGLPSPAAVSHRGITRQVLEFAPLPEASDVVLQIDVDDIGWACFSAASMRAIEGFGTRIYERMKWLWRKKSLVSRRVDAVRQAAERGIADSGWAGRSVALKRICLDAGSIGRKDEPRLIVEYSGTDDALRPGTVIDVIGGDDLLDRGLMRVPLVSSRRRALVSFLKDHGADGSPEVITWDRFPTLSRCVAHCSSRILSGVVAGLLRTGDPFPSDVLHGEQLAICSP